MMLTGQIQYSKHTSTRLNNSLIATVSPRMHVIRHLQIITLTTGRENT